MTICDSEAPPCDNGNRLVIGYSALSCCPEYRCGENKHQYFCKPSVELWVELTLRLAVRGFPQSVTRWHALLSLPPAAGKINS